MRNIEQIAAEDEAEAREVLGTRMRGFSRLVGFGLAVWGWFLFAHGQMGKGAFIVVVSLLLWALSWGILLVFQGSFAAFLTGLLSLVFGFGLYFETRLPTFYWGSDPSFWLSVNAGAVGAPFWSPLSYLLGQAGCFLLPGLQFSILPIISAATLAIALFFTAQDYFSHLKNKTLLNVIMCLLVCLAVAASTPFWNAGTLGSGLATSLGFLLFLHQRALLSLEERPWKLLYFLLGLLWSVHPLWGLLGFLNHLGSLDPNGKNLKKNLPAFLVGVTPYLWILFRAGRIFPSWGGKHPFLEMMKSGGSFWAPLVDDGSLLIAFKALGWATAILGAMTILMWFLNFFKWKAGMKIHLSAFDFWILIAAGLGGVFYYSFSAETPGSTALWFVAGLGGLMLKLLERGTERKQVAFFSGNPLAWMGAAGVLLAFGLAWLPGQSYFRDQYDFPLQHAVNLLQSLGPKSILVCRDPFDAPACMEARLMEPIATDAVILEESNLNQRWYVAQVIAEAPEILFSNIQGPTEEVLKKIVINNRDLWDIQWDLASMPKDWKGPQTAPTILTQEFLGPSTASIDPERAQYRFDLAALPKAGEVLGGQAGIYFYRYTTGFNELGKYLMGQGRYPAAIHAFERASKLDPAFKEPKEYLAQMYSQKNILEAARMEFEETIHTHPRKISSLLGELDMAQKGKNEIKTVLILDQMIHLNSELADAEYQLSKIYDREGRAAESKSLLESSIKLNPQQLEAQMSLGQLMARMGNRIKAEEAFRAVLEIDPQNKPAQVEIWKLLNKP